MSAKRTFIELTTCILLTSQLVGCATAPAAQPTTRVIPKSNLVEIAVLTTSEHTVEIPSKSRIVVSDIAGPCNVELKNALTRRLVDNNDYEVLSRDNLEQIMIESKANWAGAFNTETAVKLGRLLGASLFIVGEIVYCGSPGGRHFAYGEGQSFDIFAVLQMIDPETGRVIVSSANEGKYLPDSDPLLFTKSADDYEQPSSEVAASTPPPSESKAGKNKGLRRIMGKSQEAMERARIAIARRQAANAARTGSLMANVLTRSPAQQQTAENEGAPPTKNPSSNQRTYAAFKAAEELANGFADKFFSRPTWEKVEMFKSSYWKYGNSVRYVKLGQCQMALNHLEKIAAPEVPRMPDPDVAEYLHNYGVVLLCANQPELAMDKLRSAYRIGYDPSTLRMLGLASKIVEWSLAIEVDRQPEIGILAKRNG